MRHCAAQCGRASSVAVRPCERQCVAVRAAAVCGSVRGSVWQCAEQYVAIQQCGSVRECEAVCGSEAVRSSEALCAAVCGIVWQ
jgi:hypothetical protein